MLRSHRADLYPQQAGVRPAIRGCVLVCGLLAAGSWGVATINETRAEGPPAATAAEQGIAPVASTKGDEPAEKPERPGDVSREADIGRLIAQLNDKGDDGARSSRAAEALGRMGAEAEPAIGDLIQALADDRRPSKGYVVSVAAEEALARIGRPAVAPLIKALHDNNEDIRCGAAGVLGQMGAEAEPAVPALAEALCSQPPTGDSDTFDFLAAFAAPDALAKIGRPAVPALTKALHHGSKDVRLRAVVALGKIGAEAAAAAPDLKRLLVAEEQLLVAEDLKGPVRTALWFGGTEADRALADRVQFCWRAREVYAVIEPDKKEVVRLLSPLLRDRDYQVRRNMAVLLGDLGPEAAAAVKPLMDGLDDNALARSSRLDPNFGINRPVCCEMAEALGKIGDAARPALPKLSAMMTDDERATVRISAALAVIQIDPPSQEALGELIRILEEDLEKGSHGTAALEATLALADVGPRGRDAVPALGRALQHKKAYLRTRAAGALSSIGGAEAVPLLIFACRDPDGSVRWTAVAGLSHMGAAAAPAVPALVELWETLEANVECIDHYPLDVTIIGAFGAIGAAAAGAIPKLEKASNSEEQYVREAAVAALEKIRSASAGARPAKMVAAAPQTEEAAAIDRLEKCGARVTLLKGPSGRPSVSVEFWDCWPAVGMGGDLDAARSRHNEDLAHLKRPPQVRSLDLSGTWTSDAGLAHLRGLTGLQSLDLSFTEITDAGLAHLKGLVQLESLDLAETKVTGPGLESLAGMTRLRNLVLARKWQVRSSREPRPLDDTALRHLRGLVNLQNLDLSQTSITDAGLVYVGQFKGLKSLNLSSHFGAQGRRLGLPSEPFLDDITDAGLAHLRDLESLQSLDLSGRSITDAGVEHLKGLQSLRRLRLDGTLITEAGVKLLRQALPKATIETDRFNVWIPTEIENLGGKVTRDDDRPHKPVIGVDLSKARIGDADAAAVAKLPALETLDLSETRVTDAGLIHLQGLRQLRELDLRQTKATDTGIETLQQALPNCRIRR